MLPRRRRGWLWVALSAGIFLNGLRLRQRLSGLQRLASGDARLADEEEEEEDDFLVLKAPGTSVDGATRRAAIAHAQAEGLDVLDLVPGDLPRDQALDLARGVDTTTFRSAPLAIGRGALHVLLVRRTVWERLELGPGDVVDRADLVRLTQRLKEHAARSTDLVVAPDLRAVDVAVDQRLAQLEATYGGAYPFALAVPAARSSLLIAGLLLSPGWGAVAAAAFVLQPYLAVAGVDLHPRWRHGAAGTILDPFALIRAARARGGAGAARPEDPIEAIRPYYTAALAGGTQRFFEPRITACPWCGSSALTTRFRTTDLFQFKPGEFVMEECAGCGLLFQNPRLSLEGLDFYYRDFYEGLGAGQMKFLFAQSEPAYRERAEMARRHVSPGTWLDVGSGYGHFCLVAREVLPHTRFDGLDMGSSIEEGQRRRWIDNGHRGLFPDLAPELQGRYELVSMYHYLEHTRDPRAELAAAHAVLDPGGHLLIEVPDPECRMGRLLGRYWIPWLQPQHQQLVPVDKLCRALEDQGFTVVEVERCPAKPTLDLAGGIWMWSAALAPPPRLPWRDDPTAVERLERWLILAAMAPLGVLGVALSSALQPLIRTKAEPWSNAYRVLARRT